MKKILLLLILGVSALRAHDHVEVGTDPDDQGRLGLDGPGGYQLALYVPRGEPFSGYVPQFPGGWHACELTFTTEVSTLDAANGADPWIEILSVIGPAGGSFAFWEVGVTAPMWSRPTGWSGTSDVFPVILDGETHAHGRCFTMDRPGTYTVTFRVRDKSGAFTTSANKAITFVAQQPPQLSVATSGSHVLLSFTNRNGFACDLQVSPDLMVGSWTNVPGREFMIGAGARTNLILTNGLIGRPKAFYRLVEY
jgi:hypothetical protein